VVSGVRVRLSKQKAVDSRLAACGLRLSAFGDLATEVRFFLGDEAAGYHPLINPSIGASDEAGRDGQDVESLSLWSMMQPLFVMFSYDLHKLLHRAELSDELSVFSGMYLPYLKSGMGSFLGSVMTRPETTAIRSPCSTSLYALGLVAMAHWSTYTSTGHASMAKWSLLTAFSAWIPCVSAVGCVHCRDTITGCTGGDDCPLIADLAANVAIFTESKLGQTPRISHMLPPELSTHFPRPTCEAIVGLACAPAVGTEIDFTDAAYSSSQAVVQAAIYGHCSVAEAATVLGARMDAALSEVDVAKIQGAMDSLKIVGDRVIGSTQGVMAFLWAKVSNVVMKRDSGAVKLITGTQKAASSDLTATLTRPSSAETFFEMVHYFLMVLVSFGLASTSIASRFIDNVVWGTIRMKESWQCSHELLLLYLKEIDIDPTRTVNMGNVFRRGGQDTLLSEARRNVAAFFRPVGGNPSDEKSIKHNGKFDANSDKPCQDFNLGRPCKRLKSDGTCVFNHKCNQFVSDKGPAGVCFGDHARSKGCSYDAAKKLNKPAP
jgi:hypothetical protein